MKQKLLNSIRLRVCMLVAILCAGFTAAWADTAVYTFNTDAGLTALGISKPATSAGTNLGTTPYVVDGVSMSATDGSTATRVWNSSGTTDLRIYKSGGSLTFTAPENNNITSIVLAGSTVGNFSANVGSFSAGTWTGSSASVILTATNTGKINTITVTYSSGGTPTPTTYTVTFNAGAGTFVGSNDFPSTNNSKEAGTYTLPSATRDGYTFDGWKAGNNDPITGSYTVSAAVDFTAQYTENAPVGNYEWVLTSLADLTSTDIFVIVGNNYAMTNNNSTGSAPATSAVTVANNKITSTVTEDIKWNVSGNATNGYTFYPNGSTTTWLYCNTTAASSSNNNMRVGTGNRKVFELDDERYLITKDNYTDRYLSIYNNADWRGYINTDNAVALNFYKRQVVSNDPALYADNVNITYDASSGEISYTIENPDGSTLTAAAAAADTWISNVTVDATNNKVTFTATANSETTAREGTITLTYGSITKDVKVTQAAAPVIYTTIPALFEAATSTAANVNVTFGNWVVSGVSGSNVFVTDNNGNGFIIYTSNHGFAVNDKLSGTVMETPLKKYNGSAEFTNLTSSTTGLTVSNDGVVTVITNKTIADLGGVNTGAVITLSNLTYDGTNLSDGTNTIKPYTTLYSEMSLTSGKTYNVTGVYQQYGNNTKEILPRSAADIVEVQVQHNEYTLTVSNLSHVDLYVFDASDETNPIISGEGSAQVLDGTQVMVSVDVESGYVIESLIVDGNDVTSQIDDTDAYTFTMPTHAVTIYATVEQGISYTLATSITSGKHYVIAATTNSGTKAMGGKNASKAYYDAIDASLSGSTLSVTESSGVQEFVIYGPNADGYYSIYDPVANGYLCATSSSSNDLSYKANNDEEGLWEIDFDNQTVTAQGSYTRNMLQYNSSQPRFSCYASTTQHSVSFYEKSGEATPTESKTLNGSGYATYCSQNALDFSAATGGTAWTVSAIDNTDNTITFTQITGKAAAGTGMLLKGDANGTITMTAANGKDDLGTNLLVGTTAATDVTAGEYYGLSGATFVKVNAGTVPAGKALLDASNINENVGGNTVKSFTFVFEGADGIKTVEHVSAEQAAEIFNLAGQRMSKPQLGVNIINGKKVLVK